MNSTIEIELNELWAYIASGTVPKEVVQQCQINYSYWTRDYYTKLITAKSRILNYMGIHNGIHYFPAGWFEKVAQTYTDFGYTVNSKWIGNTKPKFAPIENTIELRDYQKKIFFEALEKEKGIIGAPTGSGKTVLYSAVVLHIGAKALIIVPSINLLNQTIKELQRFIDPGLLGRIGNSVWEPAYITVAIRDSLWNRFKASPKETKEFFSTIKTLVVDEAHHIKNSGFHPKNTYFKLVMEIKAPYRFGATATPGRPDSLSRSLLEAATGPVIGEIPMTKLVDEGFLVKPKVVVYPVEIEDPIRDWHKAYTRNIVGNKSRNALIKHLAEKYAEEGKSVLIVCNWVDKHARVLHQLIPDSQLMIGETDSELREAIKEDFSSKSSKILVSTVIQEGVNIPSMDVIILASGGKGGDEGRIQIQRIGRVMRPSSGKDQAIVIDFYDCDRSILERHSKKRIKIYREEDAYELNIITQSLNIPKISSIDDNSPKINLFLNNW